MKTYTAKPADVRREWHVIDAAGQTLGRLSTRAARLLMGKHKPIYTPSQDTGDFVVIINAEKVRFTGKKATQKLYYRHSGYPGGFKSIWLGKMMQQHPTRALEHSIKGMLPHTRLGAVMKKRLRVYAGETHPHLSQVQSEAKNEAQ
jgi:large subunit ribosomal protein L13